MRKDMDKIKLLTLKLNKLFVRTAQEFKKNNINVVMPTYAPQRGEILADLANNGVDTLIAGGLDGTSCFKEVPQIGLDEDTVCYGGIFPQHITKKIVDTIPEDKLKNRKTAVFSYTNSLGWSKFIQRRNLNTEIVATVEQNLRNFFEEKGNLVKILDAAGLSAYKIPTEYVSSDTEVYKLKIIYNKLKNELGKIVLQDCRTMFGNAGGKGTVFVNSEAEFIHEIKSGKGHRKVTRFINGAESNLSFFAGNILPEQGQLGARKVNLENEDAFNPNTLDELLAKAKLHGINEKNIVTLIGRGTLKAVGDDNLTSLEANGVGNDIGYVFDENIRKQISEIGKKLSKLMALSGKVGLAGADMIIDKSGKVYVNEINDRQQGPTVQMSKDAENNGLPSLAKTALLANFADFHNPETVKLFQELEAQKDEINQAYQTTSGEFYMKFQSTHSKGSVEKAKHNIIVGFYDIVQQENGKWKFDFASYRKSDSKTTYQTNPDDGIVTIKIVGSNIIAGDSVKSGTQLFRLTGKTNPANPPFILKNGKTVLNPIWKPIVEACYNHVFDEGYMELNPLKLKKNPPNLLFFLQQKQK